MEHDAAKPGARAQTKEETCGRHTADAEEQVKRFMHEQIVAMVAADGELIWLRYSAMLTANSIIGLFLGAIAAKGAALTWRDAVVLGLASGFGLAVSWHWYWLTKRGWAIQQAYLGGAKKYTWPGHTPVFELYEEWCRKNPPPQSKRLRRSRADTGVTPPVDLIQHHALSVIWLFIAAYLVCLLYAVISITA